VNTQNHSRQEIVRRELMKKKKAKTIRNRLIVLQIVVFVVVAALVFSLIFIPGNGSLIDFKPTKTAPETIPYTLDAPVSQRIDYTPYIIHLGDEINSANAIFIDLASGEVIADKLPDEKIYPASITKIMTAILVIEHFEDLETEIEVPSHIYSYLREQNASVAGFYAGEKVKVIDLLYGVLLPSGADACLTLVSEVAGNEQAFAKKMTEKAHEIGAINTNFVNSTGLHNDNHYSTVRDLSKILTYALKNETFRTIFTTETYTTAKTNLHSKGIKFTNTTFAAFDRANLDNPYVKGGKTGYTGEACLCLATLAEKNGREYILVTVKAGTPTSSKGTQHVKDANYIYNTYPDWTANSAS